MSNVRAIKQSKNGTKPPAIPDNLNELVLQERKQRENQCVEEVNAVLAKHNCQLLAVFSVGNQNIPIGKLVNLPSQVLIASK